MKIEPTVFSFVSGPAVKDGKHFKKELIRTGEFVKGEQKFSITKEHLAHWAKTFGLMKENGDKVPVPMGHEDLNNNKGWCEGMVVEGESLYGMLELAEPDAEQVAQTHDVSIYVPPTHTSGNGKEYGSPITHIALTSVPVIPGLKGWLCLSQALKLAEPATAAYLDLVKVQEALIAHGITDVVTNDNAGDLAIKSLLQCPVTTKEMEMSQKVAVEPVKADAKLVKNTVELRELKLSQLVKEGRITVAQKTKMLDKYGKTEILSLSLIGSGDSFDETFEVLCLNTPVQLSEQSGPQVLVLTDRNKQSSIEDSSLVKEMERRASRK